jgi:ATP/maltotriose-dependent transcriptional regulator MalT
LLASLPAVFPDLSYAWISLGEEDNDPAQFLIVLLAALRCLKSDFGPQTQAVLESNSNLEAGFKQVIAVLINEVMATMGDLWIMFDDLPLITEPAVYSLIDGLLERMPPQMRLILSTRYDPPLALSHMRARSQLAELRLPDLCFTYDEVRLFLNDETVGYVPAPNLTSGEGDAGEEFSDPDWVRAIRHGVDPGGRGLIGMPAHNYYYRAIRTCAS